MNMGMGNRLSCHSSVIDSDVEPSRLELLQELLPDLCNQPPKEALLVLGKIENAGNVLPGHNESMTFSHWKRIPESNGVLVFQKDSGRLKVAEWAVRRHGMILWVSIIMYPLGLANLSCISVDFSRLLL